MRTDTRQRILAYIKEKQGVSAKEIIGFIRISPQAVFRHLHKLNDDKQLHKIGKPPKVSYYTSAATMNTESNFINDALKWAITGDETLRKTEYFCQTRDVFQARTDRLIKTLKKLLANDNLAFIIGAMVGEIGNNSFDHNIGQWEGVPGILFVCDEKERTIIVADRGQGVRATLRRVRPQIASDAEALQVAFTEIVSGRAPEQRGNGLKFVKKVIIENNVRLVYYSGNAVAEISNAGLNIKHSAIKIPGMYACITY